MAQNSEYIIRDSLNKMLKNLGIIGLAYRFPQSKYTQQVTDILMDTTVGYYLAVECKSYMMKTSYNIDNMFQYDTNGKSQLERLVEFANLTDRDALVMCEIRKGRGKKNELYIIDAKHLLHMRRNGIKSFKITDMQKYEKHIGYYDITTYFGFLDEL